MVRYYPQIASNSVKHRTAIEKSGANLTRNQAVKNILEITGSSEMVEAVPLKYLNNFLKQDYRCIR